MVNKFECVLLVLEVLLSQCVKQWHIGGVYIIILVIKSGMPSNTLHYYNPQRMCRRVTV